MCERGHVSTCERVNMRACMSMCGHVGVCGCVHEHTCVSTSECMYVWACVRTCNQRPSSLACAPPWGSSTTVRGSSGVSARQNGFSEPPLPKTAAWERAARRPEPHVPFLHFPQGISHPTPGWGVNRGPWKGRVVRRVGMSHHTRTWEVLAELSGEIKGQMLLKQKSHTQLPVQVTRLLRT